jgi:ABC-type lipoprotein export system ATPase subunit
MLCRKQMIFKFNRETSAPYPVRPLADEPTGNLDQVAGREVMGILSGLHREGRTIVLITHDDAVAAYARREILLRDGLLVSDRGIEALGVQRI